VRRGGGEHWVPLGPAIMALLARHLAVRGPRRFLFEGRTGRPPCLRSLHAAFQRARAKAGIGARVTLLSMRYSVLAHLREAGAGAMHLRAMLGQKAGGTPAGRDARDSKGHQAWNIHDPLDGLSTSGREGSR